VKLTQTKSLRFLGVKPPKTEAVTFARVRALSRNFSLLQQRLHESRTAHASQKYCEVSRGGLQHTPITCPMLRRSLAQVVNLALRCDHWACRRSVSHPSLPPCRPVTRSFHLHLSILEYFVWRRDLQASPECLVCEGVPESSAPFIPGTGMDSTTAGQGARRSLRRFCSHLCGWQRPEPLIVSATLCCPGFMPQPARAQSSAVQL
jgi:hypothetical protein